jgi:hypothetical protein
MADWVLIEPANTTRAREARTSLVKAVGNENIVHLSNNAIAAFLNKDHTIGSIWLTRFQRRHKQPKVSFYQGYPPREKAVCGRWVDPAVRLKHEGAHAPCRKAHGLPSRMEMMEAHRAKVDAVAEAAKAKAVQATLPEPAPRIPVLGVTLDDDPMEFVAGVFAEIRDQALNLSAHAEQSLNLIDQSMNAADELNGLHKRMHDATAKLKDLLRV